MISLTLGYFFMMLIFLVVRFFYHLLHIKNFIQEVKCDFINLFAYVKQIILSNPKKFKIIFAITVVLILLQMSALDIKILNIFESSLSTINFFLFAIIFVPQENPLQKEFPVEIFGFIYSVIFMFYSAGTLIFDIFYTNNSFEENVWIYGYVVTIISYIICISTLKGFMERDLAKEEIIFLGMSMTTTLEFITYYGIGFFGGIKWYNPQAYENNVVNVFGDITNIINQGIFIASQSQILERSAVEVWGYIILNGTDVLTITVVLGYLVQKFMENK